MIHIEALRFGYRAGEDVLALDAFDLAPAEHALVVGPSGSGKTTLLHLVAGLLVATRGRVVVAGRDLVEMPAQERDRFRGRNVGIVLQQFHLLPTLSVLGNLLVAQHVAGLAVDRGAAHAALDAVGVGGLARAWPHELSVGEQQRVAIARALVNRPPLLLADEPTSNLDDDACAAVAGLLHEAAADHHAALLIATHDQRLKARIARVLALPRARVEARA
jgi:putative ABC transport system ATP-binding protein